MDVASVTERDRRLRVVVATQIFPNRVEPHSAPFNRKQLGALHQLADVDVVAPVPWLPGARLWSRWSRAGRLSAVPRHDVIDELPVSHPRRAYVPKWGGLANGPLATLSYGPALLRRRRWADVVLATWAYPDAWAATVIGNALGLPVVVKLHGSDINVIAQSTLPRTALRLVLPHASRVVAVSEALRREAIELGVPEDRACVVRNGVDREAFRPGDRSASRALLDIPATARVILFIGRLEDRKGVAELLSAFAELAADDPDAFLILVGDGALAEEARKLGERTQGRVMLTGTVAHERVPLFLAACDLLTLPSWSEGVPNVVLEALASGRRVVASDVGGIGEIVDEQAGRLVPARDAGALAGALRLELGRTYDPERVRARAPGSWLDSASELLAVLRAAVAETQSELAA